jgi:hypothetical protein
MRLRGEEWIETGTMARNDVSDSMLRSQGADWHVVLYMEAFKFGVHLFAV